MIPFRHLCRLVLSGLLATCVAGPTQAQSSAAAPPPSAKSEGGDTPQGDPNGAVRALGSADRDQGKGTVTIPDLGPKSDGRAGGPPPGTAR